MLKFSVEKWADVLPEIERLFPAHYEELAMDRDRIKLAPNVALYTQGEANGILFLAVARNEEGEAVGYFVSAVLPHLHYRYAGPMSTADAYFLLPKYRTATAGMKFLMFIEEELRKRGVTKMYISTKLHRDNSKLFEALGYRATDMLFTKVMA
jgi:GNAT superfamily N-acetyltransferase